MAITDHLRQGQAEYPGGAQQNDYSPAKMLETRGNASGRDPKDVQRDVANLGVILGNAVEHPGTFGVLDSYGSQRKMLGMLLEQAGIERPRDGRRVMVIRSGGPSPDYRTEPGVAPPQVPSYKIRI